MCRSVHSAIRAMPGYEVARLQWSSMTWMIRIPPWLRKPPFNSLRTGSHGPCKWIIYDDLPSKDCNCPLFGKIRDPLMLWVPINSDKFRRNWVDKNNSVPDSYEDVRIGISGLSCNMDILNQFMYLVESYCRSVFVELRENYRGAGRQAVNLSQTKERMVD